MSTQAERKNQLRIAAEPLLRSGEISLDDLNTIFFNHGFSLQFIDLGEQALPPSKRVWSRFRVWGKDEQFDAQAGGWYQGVVIEKEKEQATPIEVLRAFVKRG